MCVCVCVFTTVNLIQRLNEYLVNFLYPYVMKALLDLLGSHGTADVWMTKIDKSLYNPQWQNYIPNIKIPSYD